MDDFRWLVYCFQWLSSQQAIVNGLEVPEQWWEV